MMKKDFYLTYQTIGKNNVRATDTIDFRPRATAYTLEQDHHLHSKIDCLVQ